MREGCWTYGPSGSADTASRSIRRRLGGFRFNDLGGVGRMIPAPNRAGKNHCVLLDLNKTLILPSEIRDASQFPMVSTSVSVRVGFSAPSGTCFPK
jgi:hypothetical protein